MLDAPTIELSSRLSSENPMPLPDLLSTLWLLYFPVAMKLLAAKVASDGRRGLTNKA